MPMHWDGIDVLQYVATRDDKAPYLAIWIWAHTPVEIPGLGTFAVDRHWRLYWDPKLREKWTLEEAVGVLIHEIMHSGRDHADRADSQGVTEQTQLAWNAAGDAEINADVLEAFKLPQGAVTPEVIGGKKGETAETLYQRIKKLAQAHNASCGSGSGGKPLDKELPAPNGNGKADGGGSKDKKEHTGTDSGKSQTPSVPGLSPAQQEIARDAVAKEIEDAAERGIGNIPSGMRRWAKTRRHPTVDWRRALRVAVGNAVARTQGMADYTYRRRARRQAADPRLIMPGMVDVLPKVGIVADTSGSMGSPQLDAILSEAEGIIRDVAGGYGVEWVSVDAAVHDRVSGATSATQLADKLTGGGGTNMGVGIEEMHHAKCDVCVVMTDGLTPWPETAPSGMAVVVCLIPYNGHKPPVPSWARVVVVEDET